MTLEKHARVVNLFVLFSCFIVGMTLKRREKKEEKHTLGMDN